MTPSMAYDGWWLWLAFIVVGLATTVPRASFIVLGSRAALPTLVQRALRYAPAAALAAVIAPDIFVTGGELAVLSPRVGAALLVVAVVLRWSNPWLPFMTGMGALWGLRWLIG